MRWCTLAVAVALWSGCSPQGEDGASLARQIAGLNARAAARLTARADGDLRGEARQIIARLRAGVSPYLGEAPSLYAAVTLPTTIKVWRKSQGGAGSCSGKVDVLPFEEYIKGVLPHEWITSWEVESLRAGAIAIRSYAAAWIVKGGKYTCADLDDTTSSQVYKDTRNAKASRAVDDTRGMVVIEAANKVVFAEYSAENGDPTQLGVSDPPCAGKKLFGHGRGMCQWGSQRWALQGKAHKWIAEHYYPGSTLVSTTAVGPDLGVPRDQGVPGDRGVPGDPDAPRADQEPAVGDHTGDGPRAVRDTIKRIDLRVWRDGGSSPGQAHGALRGGCAIGEAAAPDVLDVLGVLGLLALLLVWRRHPLRRSSRSCKTSK